MEHHEEDDDESFATVAEEDNSTMIRRYENELQELREEKAEAEAARKRAEKFFDEVVATVKSGIDLNEALEARCRKAEAENARLAGLLVDAEHGQRQAIRANQALKEQLEQQELTSTKSNDNEHQRATIMKLKEEIKINRNWHLKEVQDLEARIQELVRARDTELAYRVEYESELKNKLQEQRRLLLAERAARQNTESQLNNTISQLYVNKEKERTHRSTATNTTPRQTVTKSATTSPTRDTSTIYKKPPTSPLPHSKKVPKSPLPTPEEGNKPELVNEDYKQNEDEKEETEYNREDISSPPPPPPPPRSLDTTSKQNHTPSPQLPPSQHAPLALVSIQRRFAHGGLRILKHGRNGAPRWRLLNYDQHSGILSWQSGKDTHCFHLASVIVRKGKTTPVFERRASRSALAAHCFSLIAQDANGSAEASISPTSRFSPGSTGADRFSLDLQAESMHERDVLSEGFELLIYQLNSTTRSPVRPLSSSGSPKTLARTLRSPAAEDSVSPLKG